MEFDEPATRRRLGPIGASLTSEGEFRFDLEGWRQLGEPEAVVFLYDGGTQTIGLRRADATALNAVKVRSIDHGRRRCAQSMPFIRRHRVEIQFDTVRFPYAHVEDGILILNMRESVKAGPGRRRGS